MCPSFMATREEEHSTRGRANLLRAALSGWLPAKN
jgi:Fe-S oxidoreductase